MTDGNAAGDMSFRSQSELSLNAFANVAATHSTVPAKRRIDSVAGSQISRNSSPHPRPGAYEPSHTGVEGKLADDRLTFTPPPGRNPHEQSFPTRSLPSIAQLTGSLDRNVHNKQPFGQMRPELPSSIESARLETESREMLSHRHSLPGFHRQDVQIGSRAFAPFVGLPDTSPSYSAAVSSDGDSRSRPPDRQEPAQFFEAAAQLAPIQQRPQTHNAESDGKEMPAVHVAAKSRIDETSAADAFRRDMQLVQDSTSRVYYFATGAAPGTGNDVPLDTPNPRLIRVPSQNQFENAVEQVRETLKILERWQESEYGAPPRMPGLKGLESSGKYHDSTSSSGEAGLANSSSDVSYNQGTVPLPSGRRSAWDQSDTEAMKNRKRSAPKTPGLGAPASTTPNAVSETSSAAARVAPPGKCHSCKISETPEWRRGPDGARTLCNACGLHFAKMAKKKQQQEAGRRLPPS